NILGIPVSADVRINNNAFNFSGMETNISRLDAYGNQKKFKLEVEIALGGDEAASLYAEHAGGTASNNTYKWYKDGTLFRTTTNGGNYIVVPTGVYRVEVTNSLVPGLTLVSGDEVIAAMPVTLVSFDGKHESNQTKLTWKTTSETNNKGFEIERSADARTFEKIGFVDGSGDTKEDQFYHFTDLNPLATGYYRLKQLDYDGQFEYSKITTVKSGNAVLKMYPNPATNEVTVSGVEEGQDLHILNEVGRVVLKAQTANGKPMSVRALKPGLYVIRAGAGTGRLLIGR
ncbi:Por secretion system C-terminal sorting domain-containing protein, partial [Dyadobacter sp. SG02]|uniref:T9SS type A sorting domain-containing protein n=1 Tax=Dyadobacter sp. SG02 TaxID=1855291 RepID=UPI0008AB5009